MSTDQAAKFAHQLILLTNTFLDLVIKRKKKTHACHATERVTNKKVKK